MKGSPALDTWPSHRSLSCRANGASNRTESVPFILLSTPNGIRAVRAHHGLRTALNAIERFSTPLRSWHRLTPFPQRRSRHLACTEEGKDNDREHKNT